MSLRDEDAERSVIGSCILDPEHIDDVALIIRPSDFLLGTRGVFFQAMLDMQEAGKRIDGLLLRKWLTSNKLLQEERDSKEFVDCVESVPVAAHAVHYAEIVRDNAVLRALGEAGHRIVGLASGTDGTPRERLAEAERAVFGILDQRVDRGVRKFADVLTEALAAIDERTRNKALAGLHTGFADLDRLTCGLRGGELVVVAARPGVGKTSLASNIAEHVSLDGDRQAVLFFSLEMNQLELAERIVCGRAKLDSADSRNGAFRPEQYAALTKAANHLSRADLYIDDTPGRSMSEIAAVSRRMKRRHKLALVVVDYLTRVQPDSYREPREQQVAAIAQRLKTMARELNVPVICLAQMNRQVESDKAHRPRLSHLRESGAIEQEADQVWFVHREDCYRDDPAQHDNLAEIIVEKNRNGRTGIVTLCWFPVFTRFGSCAKGPDGRPQAGDYTPPGGEDVTEMFQ